MLPKKRLKCDKCGENLFKKIKPPESYNGTKDKLVNIGIIQKREDGSFRKKICRKCRGWGQKKPNEALDGKESGYERIGCFNQHLS